MIATSKKRAQSQKLIRYDGQKNPHRSVANGKPATATAPAIVRNATFVMAKRDSRRRRRNPPAAKAKDHTSCSKIVRPPIGVTRYSSPRASLTMLAVPFLAMVLPALLSIHTIAHAKFNENIYSWVQRDVIQVFDTAVRGWNTLPQCSPEKRCSRSTVAKSPSHLLTPREEGFECYRDFANCLWVTARFDTSGLSSSRRSECLFARLNFLNRHRGQHEQAEENKNETSLPLLWPQAPQVDSYRADSSAQDAYDW